MKEEVARRLNAKDGFWAMYLLPTAIIISTIRYIISVTLTYKLMSLLSVGMILTSIFIPGKLLIRTPQYLTLVIIAILTSFLYLICVDKGLFFGLLSGICSTFVYFELHRKILYQWRGCFTIGEAAIISQAMTFFIYSTLLSVINYSEGTLELKSNAQISTVIIQFGLLGISTIYCTKHHFDRNKVCAFYIWSAMIIIVVILLPLHVIIERSPILWIMNRITDSSNAKILVYWSVCSLIGVFVVRHQILSARRASTRRRKVFHILAVIVFVPGLLYNCSLLYLASGLIFGLFIALETLRILQIPPLGVHLQDGFTVFSDEKDGALSLTPLYLMAGCSLPLWVHPSPCDVTDSGQFNLIPLMSGLLSIGLGDTAASIVGSKIGKYKWSGSNRTKEGTAACILVQIGFIKLLEYLRIIVALTPNEMVKLGLAVIITSLVEAKTTQVDNLVLPLVMYNILVMCNV